MSARLDVSSDMATAQLLDLAHGLKLSGLVPVASGRELVALAGAVRRFLAAREPRLAEGALDAMLAMVAGDSGDELGEVREALARAARRVAPLFPLHEKYTARRTS